MNIIITGAGKGIGFETARLLCTGNDNKVIALSRNIGALNKLAKQLSKDKIGGKFYPVSIDLNKRGCEKKLITFFTHHFKKIDILINNAGVLVNKPFDKLTSSDFDAMFSVNVKAPFFLIQALIPYFNKPAHIVNVSSMGGFQGSAKFSGLSLYSASKGALAILTECMAVELKDKKISVNCLALGSVRTEMLAKAFPGYSASVLPAEMAGFIVNFALNTHKVVNGKIIPVALSAP
jgi:NAD(P)-dependent dehydrogenase (short-subunit alcohol dehydrogenase family)